MLQQGAMENGTLWLHLQATLCLHQHCVWAVCKICVSPIMTLYFLFTSLLDNLLALLKK